MYKEALEGLPRMGQVQALVSLTRIGLRSFLSESSKMPPKPTSGISGKVNKVSKGVQYPMLSGEKGNNNERQGFFYDPILQ